MMNSSDFFASVSAQMEPIFSRLAELGETFSQPIRAKVLLVFNHLISQEPEAVERLRVYAGRRVMLESPMGQWPLTITPAGLFEETPKDEVQADSGKADLHLKMQTPSPMDFGNMLFKGQRPPVAIDGDADLAATFAWLVDHLRWDYAEDLSRIVGDVPTQIAMDQFKQVVSMFRGFLEAFSKRTGGKSE